MPWCAGMSGNRMWYEERGTGKPIVLIHGWCMSSAIWGAQLDGLSRSQRVIAIDLPGHGQSEVPAEGFSLTGCAADLSGMFEALDLRDVLLVGWSLGSLIALASCELLKERLSGMVLVAATPKFTQCADFLYGLSQMEVEGMARKVQRSLQRARDGFAGRMFSPGELDEPVLSATIHRLLSQVPLPTAAVALQALEVLAEADLRDRLDQLVLPTLILCGDSDVICLPQASDFLARRIPSARQVLFAGCGHAPFLTQSSRFNDCIEEFRRMVSSVD